MQVNVTYPVNCNVTINERVNDPRFVILNSTQLNMPHTGGYKGKEA